MQGSLRETRPAAAAGNEADIEEEQDGKQQIAYGHGDGSTNEAPFQSLLVISQSIRAHSIARGKICSTRGQYPDKQPIHEHIQGSTYEEDI